MKIENDETKELEEDYFEDYVVSNSKNNNKSNSFSKQTNLELNEHKKLEEKKSKSPSKKIKNSNAMWSKSGIYLIENKKSGKKFVGHSLEVEKKLKSLKNKKSKNHINFFHKLDKVNNDITEFGIESFEFSILEFCDPWEMEDKTQKYIIEFNSINEGYNTKTNYNFEDYIKGSDNQAIIKKYNFNNKKYSSFKELEKVIYNKRNNLIEVFLKIRNSNNGSWIKKSENIIEWTYDKREISLLTFEEFRDAIKEINSKEEDINEIEIVSSTRLKMVWQILIGATIIIAVLLSVILIF